MENNFIASFMQQKTHPLNFVILPILFLIWIFLANNSGQYSVILGIAYLNLLLLVKPIKYKLILFFILSLLPILLAIFLSTYIFANTTALPKINIALLLTTRYFSLALIAFAYTIHTPFAKIFNYLIERRILSVQIGYGILAAFNSFYFLAQEFWRIQTAYKMRYSKRFISPLIFIALLTAAARYAHNISISMHSRGIDQRKTFVTLIPRLKYFDYLLWLFNLIILLGVIT